MDLSLRLQPKAKEHPELPPWRRMGRYVFKQVRSHPGILALEASRRGSHIIVNVHERGIWLAYEPSVGSGAWEVEYRIIRGEWWSPLTRRKGNLLAKDQVDGLLDEWVRWRTGSTSENERNR